MAAMFQLDGKIAVVTGAARASAVRGPSRSHMPAPM